MNNNARKIACIGECMLEFSPIGDDKFKQTFAGDSYNTSVYLKRQFGDALSVSYFTGVGEDVLSEKMLAKFRTEQIDTSFVKKVKGRRTGLYIIENDSSGERSFQYWRSSSAAKFMFQDCDISSLVAELSAFDLIYLSGITLAILCEAQRELLISALHKLKNDVIIAFDPNYREALWSSMSECHGAFREMAKVSSIVLSTTEEEKSVWNFDDINASVQNWKQYGVEEIIIKDGANGCYISNEIGIVQVPTAGKLTPIDTTGAGDSFSAGFLGSKILGASSEDAAVMGHKVAAQVVMQKGGVIDMAAWAPVEESWLHG